MTPPETTALAAEIANLRGDINGFRSDINAVGRDLSDIKTACAVLVERSNRTEQDVRDLRRELEDEVRKLREDEIKPLESELAAVKGFPRALAREEGPALIAALDAVAELSDDELERYPRQARRGAGRPPPELEAMVERLKSVRNRRAEEIGLPRGTLLSNAVTDLNLTDVETCYKALTREVAMRLDLRSRRFGIEPEITSKVARLRARVYEVPISYHGRTYAEGKKIGLKDGLEAVWTILRFSRWEAPAGDVGAVTLRRMARLGTYNAWLHDRFDAFLGRRILEVGSGVGNQTQYFIDRDRVVVYGGGASGAMAYLTAFRVRDVVRGVVAIDASIPLLVARPPDCDPLERLSVVVVQYADSPAAARIQQNVELLREMKYPVVHKKVDGKRRDLDEETRAEVLRWIDTLDKF